MSPALWVLTVVLAAFFLCGPRAYELPAVGWAKARQVAQLWAEYQRLSLENARLERLRRFFHTSEGEEVLLRGRFNMVRKGEYLVRVTEPPRPSSTRRGGLRAWIDSLRRRADTDLELLRTSWRLMHESRLRKLAE